MVRFRLGELLRAHQPLISQAQLSRQSGISLTTINAMVNNKTTRVDLATLGALARVLGCHPGDLVERETEDEDLRAVAEPKKPYGAKRPPKKRKR